MCESQGDRSGTKDMNKQGSSSDVRFVFLLVSRSNPGGIHARGGGIRALCDGKVKGIIPQILTLHNLELRSWKRQSNSVGGTGGGTQSTGWSGVVGTKSRPAAEEGMDGNAWHVSIQALFWQCVV